VQCHNSASRIAQVPAALGSDPNSGQGARSGQNCITELGSDPDAAGDANTSVNRLDAAVCRVRHSRSPEGAKRIPGKPNPGTSLRCPEGAWRTAHRHGPGIRFAPSGLRVMPMRRSSDWMLRCAACVIPVARKERSGFRESRFPEPACVVQKEHGARRTVTTPESASLLPRCPGIRFATSGLRPYGYVG